MQRNSFRIIAGDWRSRRLRFPARPGLRPTPDRVRETLFNWLQPTIIGSRCLDLCAGSGALGLEAASRGAAEVTFVERDRVLADAIGEHLTTLDAKACKVITGDAARVLRTLAGSYDVIFLDPPYSTDLAPRLLSLIGSRELLRPAGRVYLECFAGGEVPADEGWEMLRSGTAGQVGYHLLARCEAPDGDEG